MFPSGHVSKDKLKEPQLNAVTPPLTRLSRQINFLILVADNFSNPKLIDLVRYML